MKVPYVVMFGPEDGSWYAVAVLDVSGEYTLVVDPKGGNYKSARAAAEKEFRNFLERVKMARNLLPKE